MSGLVFPLQVKGGVDLNPPGEYFLHSAKHQVESFLMSSSWTYLSSPVIKKQESWRKVI